MHFYFCNISGFDDQCPHDIVHSKVDFVKTMSLIYGSPAETNRSLAKKSAPVQCPTPVVLMVLWDELQDDLLDTTRMLAVKTNLAMLDINSAGLESLAADPGRPGMYVTHQSINCLVQGAWRGAENAELENTGP